jgi:acetolactate synthase I/III small subunit
MKNYAGNIIELTVQNHAGVLSHIAGLFSRRGFNLQAVFCAPKGGSLSLVYLLVSDDNRLSQIISQLGKLYDVRKVSLRPDSGHRLFKRLHALIRKRAV